MNEIVQRARVLDLSTWQTIQAVSPTMKASRLFGVGSDAQAAAIMCKGYELGLTLTASFEFIVVVQDKPALSPRGALALILNSPLLKEIKVDDHVDNKGNPTHCTVTMTRTNGFTYSVTYSMEDAKRAGLVRPDSGWAKYPGNMLRWRAIGFCADVVFPDVIGGLKRADEYGADLTPEGEAIEGTFKVVEDEPAPVDLGQMLSELVKEFGGQAVIDANDGRVPGTLEEVEAVSAALRKEKNDVEDAT